MNGSANCVECNVLTSDYQYIEGRYYCDDHASVGRERRATLLRSKAMMGNRNAAKRSGNPARRAAALGVPVSPGGSSNG